MCGFTAADMEKLLAKVEVSIPRQSRGLYGVNRSKR